MSKKNSARRKNAGADAGLAGKKYEGERVSAVFDYNELCLARASELLAPRLAGVTMVASFASLLAIVLVALVEKDQLVLLVVLFVISFSLLQASRNIGKLKMRYARGTNLLPDGEALRRRVVVCDDAVHVEREDGSAESYNLSELRRVGETSDSILACFGNKRYVYIPRMALSEGRFREVSRILKGHLGK